MPDALLVLTGVLVSATFGVMFAYYQLLRRAKSEYDKAKEVVDDIVLSFDRQLGREAERLEIVAYRIEGLASKSDRAISKAVEVESLLHSLESKVNPVAENNGKVQSRLDEVGSDIRDLVASREALLSKLTSIEQQVRLAPTSSEQSVDWVIPIRKDRALSPLTDTELSALEFLSKEGPKTAPEIKDKIGLSREHTARLMKKLYESGYLERDTNKIPFRYSVKKEMEKLLKREETETS